MQLHSTKAIERPIVIAWDAEMCAQKPNDLAFPSTPKHGKDAVEHRVMPTTRQLELF